MRKICTLCICCSFVVSCYQREPDEPKICKCKIQEYERIVLYKNENDGSFISYSDTGWLTKGDLQDDSSSDCFKDETEKNNEFSSTYDSQYRREIYRKWIYKCK